jgi:hypothetical protein
MDFETALGKLILAHEKEEGLEVILQTLDFYILTLEIRRDQEDLEAESN